MKEELYTIPVNEGFEADDECPFCYMERDVEQHAIRYVAGPAATYMEPDVRAATGRVGFCSHHMKSLFDYGNHLGAAMMLQTHVVSVLDELKKVAEHPQIPEKKVFSKRRLFQKKCLTGRFLLLGRIPVISVIRSSIICPVGFIPFLSYSKNRSLERKCRTVKDFACVILDSFFRKRKPVCRTANGIGFMLRYIN